MMLTSYSANGSSSYYHNSQSLSYNIRKNSSCSSSLEEFSTESPFSHESDKNFEKFLNLDEPVDSPKRESNDMHNEKIENNYTMPLIKQDYEICLSQHTSNMQMIPQPGAMFPAYGMDMRYLQGFRLPPYGSSVQHSQMPTAGTSSRYGELRTPEINEPNFTKILEKSKRILKREKAKNRSLLKQSGQNTAENNIHLNPISSNNLTILKVIPEIIEEEVLTQGEKSLNSGNQGEAAALNKKQREMMQKIRNRISAQQSRDRRKEYIQNLEKENQNLRNENQRLKEKLQKQQQKLSVHNKRGKNDIATPEKGTVVDFDNYMANVGKDNKVILALFTLVSLFFFLQYTHGSIFGKSSGAPAENVTSGPSGDIYIDKPVNIGNNNPLDMEDIDHLYMQVSKDKKKDRLASKERHSTCGTKSDPKTSVKRRGRHKKSNDKKELPE